MHNETSARSRINVVANKALEAPDQPELETVLEGEPCTLVLRAVHSVWCTWVNTDLTEGRGHQVIRDHCRLRSTARRLGAHADVQGGPAQIDVWPALDLVVNRRRITYGPITWATEAPEDTRVDEQARERENAEARALELGMTPKEIAALKGEGGTR